MAAFDRIKGSVERSGKVSPAGVHFLMEAAQKVVLDIRSKICLRVLRYSAHDTGKNSLPWRKFLYVKKSYLSSGDGPSGQCVQGGQGGQCVQCGKGGQGAQGGQGGHRVQGGKGGQGGKTGQCGRCGQGGQPG